ncbi:hypothetical protein FBEOM_11202 [Fusarium beomiforme]|uniref:Uncharacterized protein n=1 Tax=Fusarium beomiforme TaxID=44412 RepID=A0A9P5DTL7_9HYPO|nr:hypothetical protein FBEOM_11202 [Fusarium beomiforme]
MAFMLAPYNEAMRLGMGFTQQLCVNDAVQLPGGIKASENDLVVSAAADPKGEPAPGVPKYNPTGEVTPYGYPKTTGGTVFRKHKDGSQADISQVVTWTSTFVNNISEVTENMNIKGSLAIKIDAIGGGAKAQANYLNTESFKKSDINYHLQVDVVNQRLFGDNVTEFMPIKNVQRNQFQDVYGDSFISGFLEGGVFNAIISIELANKNEVKDFGGELSIQAKFAGGAVQVEGEGSGQKKSSSQSTNDKITVSVSWSGGGDIITDDVETSGWNMDTLKSVAMSFADKVALCPQKTNAIITKYSSLRSFYEKSLYGSPLDYENAGVYASALLDAYMDYKSAWKELQVMSYQVSNALAVLKKAEDQPEIKGMLEEAEKNYNDQLELYAAASGPKDSSEQKSLVKYNPESSGKVGKPLPPNKLVPYAPSVFGLDQAQRDCRFEMIKIVREVDAVAEDPQIAVDPSRNNQFLSPVVFRQLMPAARRVDPVEMEQKIESLTSDVKALTTEREALSTELTSTQSDLQTATEEKNASMVSLESATNRADVATDQLRDTEILLQAISRESSNKISALETEISELRGNLQRITSDLEAANSTIKALNTQLDVYNKDGDKTAGLNKIISQQEAAILEWKRELENEKTAKTGAIDSLQAKLAGAEQRERERTTELNKSITEIQNLEATNRSLSNTIQTLNATVDQRQTELEAQKRSVLELTSQRDSLQIQASPSWDPRNNLDAGFHGRTIQLVNMWSMDSGIGYALDMGRDGGSSVHAIKFSPGNGNQKLRFEKSDPSTRTSTCTLVCTTSPNLDGCCQWFIKKVQDSRGYIIQNVQYGYIHLDAAGDGAPIRSSSSGSAGNHVWAIIGV